MKMICNGEMSRISRVVWILLIALVSELRPAVALQDCITGLIECSRPMMYPTILTVLGNASNPETRKTPCTAYKQYTSCMANNGDECNSEYEYIMGRRLVENGMGRLCNDQEEYVYKEYQKHASCYVKSPKMAKCVDEMVKKLQDGTNMADNELCSPTLKMLTCLSDQVRANCGGNALKLSLILLPSTFPFEFVSCLEELDKLTDSKNFFQEMTDDDGKQMNKAYISWLVSSGSTKYSQGAVIFSVLVSVAFWLISRSRS
ncbi:uncharacterized protein LOC135490995 [Lineus longissimus]|uniref:uncharacterized protein LOC135490995 n=1 Tax=Lineus longissimus TaxID=88925 RepID=UPI002B4F42D6